ncbi:MAG: YrzE family protein [Actinomycetota bacterium]|nr:YrzE family protein [Actinomycetota bacterium]
MTDQSRPDPTRSGSTGSGTSRPTHSTGASGDSGNASSEAPAGRGTHAADRRDDGSQTAVDQPVVEDRSDVRERRLDEEKALEARRREEFGGLNLGADFFGWLVAIAVTLLLTGIIGAILTGVNSSVSITQDEAERSAGTIGIASAILLLVVLMIGYYFGGYVAGRMSRFDGGRQGLGVWLIGLIVTAVVVVVGLIFGNEYDVFRRVDLPSLPIPTDTATVSGLIALAAVLLGTLLAAMLGGKAGQRYHRKVDRVVV